MEVVQGIGMVKEVNNEMLERRLAKHMGLTRVRWKTRTHKANP